MVFSEQRGKVGGPIAWLALTLDKYGKVLGNRWQHHPGLKGGNEMVLTLCRPPLQTIAFLHCRNLRRATVRPEPKVNAKYRKRTRRDLVSFQTVRLELPRRAQERVGRGSGDAGARALHIVAGYSRTTATAALPPPPVLQRSTATACPECGGHAPHGKLFGHLDGIYGIDTHARGQASEGAVVTDFEVRGVG